MKPSRENIIRVVIVDDSPLIRIGLRATLEGNTGIEITGEAANAADGIALVEKFKPDVVLLDLRLPDKPGFVACREMLRRRPGLKVLILTSSSEARNVQEALAAGALGYLLKENDGASLAAAIGRVAAGHSVIDPSLHDHVVRLVRHQTGQSAADKIKALSNQEQKVVALLSAGLTNKEIGEKLDLTEKTVKNYLATIFEKLGIARRSQAAALHVEGQHQGNFPTG